MKDYNIMHNSYILVYSLQVLNLKSVLNASRPIPVGLWIGLKTQVHQPYFHLQKSNLLDFCWVWFSFGSSDCNCLWLEMMPMIFTKIHQPGWISVYPTKIQQKRFPIFEIFVCFFAGWSFRWQSLPMWFTNKRPTFVTHPLSNSWAGFRLIF